MKDVVIKITTELGAEYDCNGRYCNKTNVGVCECYDIDSKENIHKLECLQYPNREIIITNKFRDFHSLSEVIKWKLR